MSDTSLSTAIDHQPDEVIDDSTPVDAISVETTTAAATAPLSTEPPVNATDASGEGKTEDSKVEIPELPQQNTQIKYPVFGQLPATGFSERLEWLSLPSNFSQIVRAKLDNTPNIKLTDSPETQDWAETLRDGSDLSSFGNAFEKTLQDSEAEFGQTVQGATGELRASHPVFNTAAGESLKGDRAVQRMNAFMRLGSIFRFPLWNTGIWVSVKPPGEAQLLELNRLNIADKINFGRQTYGLAFSNMSAIIADRLVTFVLDNLYSTSVKEDVKLIDLISCQDIPILIWGIANAIYPNGFQYRRACSCDPVKCQHIVEERLNLSKICWTNQRGLSQIQLAHMGKSGAKVHDVASIEAYKREMLLAQNRQVTLPSTSGNELKMVLRVPTIAQYVESGHRWIGDITTTVNKALGLEASDSERNKYVLENGQVSAMRQYVHWIESVTFGADDAGEPAKIDDRETIEKLCSEVWSQDDVLREAFMEAVAKYIDDTQISVIGIPTYDCPKCEGEQKPEKALPHVTNVIPLDPYQTFFTLLVQRLQRIETR